MSSIPGVNRAAAESVAAGSEEMIGMLMLGLQLTHILQVYTSSMVRWSIEMQLIMRRFLSDLSGCRCGMGLVELFEQCVLCIIENSCPLD